jgi:hypothetical protein
MRRYRSTLGSLIFIKRTQAPRLEDLIQYDAICHLWSAIVRLCPLKQILVVANALLTVLGKVSSFPWGRLNTGQP